MRITPVDSIFTVKFAVRRPVPKSFSDLVESLAKKEQVKRAY